MILTAKNLKTLSDLANGPKYLRIEDLRDDIVEMAKLGHYDLVMKKSSISEQALKDLATNNFKITFDNDLDTVKISWDEVSE